MVMMILLSGLPFFSSFPDCWLLSFIDCVSTRRRKNGGERKRLVVVVVVMAEMRWSEVWEGLEEDHEEREEVGKKINEILFYLEKRIMFC